MTVVIQIIHHSHNFGGVLGRSVDIDDVWLTGSVEEAMGLQAPLLPESVWGL
jgi:hypothetical protein